MVVTVVGDSGGCASGGDSSMKKINKCPRISLDCAAFESVRKHPIHRWKTIRIQWNIQGIRTWFPKT